jgi:aspartyl-tRNA(Asn)/glutamyl-tRNA(Gln) amidotransferase subunit A
MSDLTTLTLTQASEKLAAGDVTSTELTQAFLDRINTVEDKVQAYLSVTTKRALEQAAEADRRREEGEGGPLLGVPLAYKDVLATEGIETTCGSRILEGYRPPYTATVVARLEQAGAVMLGKLNMDEFAMGSSTENSGYKNTLNPWDLSRVPGGSSGGSTAAVAARQAVATLGTDTGGSVRQPAALCGVVGLKPSYGRVSRYGLVAYASSLDQIGPIAHTVTDAAILLNAIAGHDPRDSTSVPGEVPDFTAGLTTDLTGMRVGVPVEYFEQGGLQTEVEQSVRAAITHLESLGATVKPIHLTMLKYAVPVYYLIATAECSANLARFDGIRYGPRRNAGSVEETFRATRGQGFGDEVKRRIMLGTFVLSEGYSDQYYVKAQKARTLIRQEYDAAFDEVDVIAGPTAPTTAFPIGDKVDDPLQMYLSDIYTISVNLAGLPGISVPCGFDDEGLPIGLHLVGPAFKEENILKAAHAYEQTTEWHTHHPDL